MQLSKVGSINPKRDRFPDSVILFEHEVAIDDLGKDHFSPFKLFKGLRFISKGHDFIQKADQAYLPNFQPNRLKINPETRKITDLYNPEYEYRFTLTPDQQLKLNQCKYYRPPPRLSDEDLSIWRSNHDSNNQLEAFFKLDDQGKPTWPKTDEVGEVYEGDFWLSLGYTRQKGLTCGKAIKGHQLHIPFTQGELNSDRSTWLFSNQEGSVYRYGSDEDFTDYLVQITNDQLKQALDQLALSPEMMKEYLPNGFEGITKARLLEEVNASPKERRALFLKRYREQEKQQ